MDNLIKMGGVGQIMMEQQPTGFQAHTQPSHALQSIMHHPQIFISSMPGSPSNQLRSNNHPPYPLHMMGGAHPLNSSANPGMPNLA
jgi:hypothetical protein